MTSTHKDSKKGIYVKYKEEEIGLAKNILIKLTFTTFTN